MFFKKFIRLYWVRFHIVNYNENNVFKQHFCKKNYFMFKGNHLFKITAIDIKIIL